MVAALVGLLIVGLIAGFIARLFVRSPERLGCIGTMLLGVIGSYAGGTLGVLLFHQAFDVRQAGTLIGAIAGSIVVLVVWRVFAGSREDRALRRRRGY